MFARVVSDLLSRSLIVALILFWLASPAVYAAERGALFRVSLDGHVMHLFGTLHVGVPAIYPLESRVAYALAGASTLALEIDPDQPQRERLRALRAHGMLDAGSPGYDALDPERQALLDRLIAQGGLDAASVKRFKPVLLATLLTLAEYTKQGYRSELSSEAWLARTARANGARVLELESLDRQLAALDGLAEADRWRFLDETMAAIASGAQRADARAVVQAWSGADREALDRIAARCELDASVSGAFVTRVLLKERNVGLADGLLQLLRQERQTFGAVGVLHLLGNNSVPALLRERGASVERIY
jgi:uncharacterized protein YbaP (TraB family)